MMNKLNENMKNYFLPISLILIISLSRIIPHPYNFTPLLAVGIFSGFYFRKFIVGLFVTILAMFIGDLYLGFHNTMFFTYIALIVPVALGIFIKIPFSMQNSNFFPLLNTAKPVHNFD